MIIQIARQGHHTDIVLLFLDLVRLAGLEGPAVGVICELLKPDDPTGCMARRDDCFAFAKQHGLKMISIEQLAEYRQRHNL